MLTDCANANQSQRLLVAYHSVACALHELGKISGHLNEARQEAYSLHAKLPHMTGCNDTPLAMFVCTVSIAAIN